MRDQEIIGLWEAYQQVHAQPQEEVEVVDEATRLGTESRRRAVDLGAKRRRTPAYKQGLNRQTGNRERGYYNLANRQASSNADLETQKMTGDTGAHGHNYADRMDKRDPEKNPKHNANKETAAESFDLSDYLLEYLVAEGYADTNKAALAIMANMSEEWKQNIVEDIRGAITYNPNTAIGKLKRRIKGSTPEKREARTRDYQGNRSDSAERFSGSQRASYDDNRGDIPALRGR